MSAADTRVIVVHNPPRRRRRSKDKPPLMRIVLLGSSVSENSLVGNLILGRAVFDSEAPPDVVERVAGRLKDRHVMIINSPQLLQTNISDHQITQTVRECVFLSDPGPHVFIIILQYKDFTEEDRYRVEYVLETFSEEAIKHTIVLTTDEETDEGASGKVNEFIQRLTAECAGGHVQFNNEIEEWCSIISQQLEKIFGENHGAFLTCELFYDAEETLLDEDQSRSFASFRTKEADSDGGVSAARQQKLNLVLCGSDETLKKSISKLLKQKRRDVELHDRLINLLELPALIGLSEEEVMRQTLRCVSLCHPGVHAFLLIIPDAPLNNEAKAEIEQIHRIFSSRINKHIMILIKQSSEHQTEELNEETQSVIERFGGRHQFFGPKTQVSTLMENIEQMLQENRGECFSTEMFLEAQMKKLMKYEEMKKKIHSQETHLLSQGSSESEDDLRIVLLGKTGVGKSASGNTILGREAFTAEESFESVTKESQRQTSEINSRRVTVIDTPGLFDTELSNEEIQREIRHCISMILPGPHVFLLLIPLGRFTKEEETSVKIIQETFGEHSLMYTMVLFTRGDFLKKKTIDQFLGKPGSPLMNLIEACGNRYHVFNNNQTEDRTQVTDLLQKIDAMVKTNGGSFYSCKMFREMEREKQEQQMKILMDRVTEREEEMKKLEEENERMKRMMEEERQNQHKERKRREELKREIREQEKHQKETREEMRRERETFRQEIEDMKKEKEKLQNKYDTEIDKLMNRIENERQNHDKERNRREDDLREREERHKREMKEQEQMRDEMKREKEEFKNEIKEMKKEIETVKKEKENLQTETDRLMNRIENERQNHETERKRREEEFNGREKRYKREMKEKEREMKGEMKRERDEWEKQKLEEETRREIGDEKRREKDKQIQSEMEGIIREKERIERERREQLEDSEKRLREERKMREDQQKTLEEKLRLLEEQHEEELKRRRVECREEYEREEYEQEKEEICSETDPSLQVTAYRKLETEYRKWSWSLHRAMIGTENKLHNLIENEVIHEVEETDLHRELKKTSEEVQTSMSKFFEKDRDKYILIQWKTTVEIKIKELQENIVRETKRKLNEILQQRDLKKKIDAQRKHHENTLYEKSKELALKLKDKTNDEETLKKEFDLFWKQSVMNIIRDTPPIRDIDIMRDVREILSDIYECVPVDHWRESRDIFSVQSYSDYVQIKKSSGITGALTNVYRSAKEKLGLILSREDETQIRSLVIDVVQQTDKMIQSFNISKMGYNKSCIQQLTDYIKTRVTEHEEGPVRYVFTNEFFMDLVLSICERANKVITDQHRLFKEDNDPEIYVKKKEEEYYSIFQKYCRGATSAVIFGEIICQKLKESIEQSVYKNTAIDLADEVRSNCPSLNGNRSNLEKHILKTLAEEEDFKKYMNYLHNPRDHFKRFIRDEVSRYITDRFTVLPRMKDNIKLLQLKIMEAAHQSTEHVQLNRGDAGLWLKSFSQQISEELIFSEKHLSGVKHHDVEDFNLLQDVMRHELPAIVYHISRKFNTNTFPVKLDYKFRPDELLIKYLCQCCWVQCPFCGAVCTNTTENHDGDHSVAFHRVTGVNGWFYRGTTNLSVSICTSAVASYQYFYPSDSDESVLYIEYRRAGGVYADWSITPDHSELLYWKWFVCRFQKHLEKHYNKTFEGNGKIPDEWRTYSKQDALESLDKYL